MKLIETNFAIWHKDKGPLLTRSTRKIHCIN